MNRESPEWRALEAYVTKRRAEIERALTQTQSENETLEKRIEYRLLGELLRKVGSPEREPHEPKDFGLKQ
jgi:hypothetical protein